MAVRSSRIVVRTEPASARRLRYAASLMRQSLSAFMLDAATDRAERVISAARDATVPAAFFDSLWNALDRPPRARRALARLAARPRRVRQIG
jgi:uncharacterized protein (DUF1778 family)